MRSLKTAVSIAVLVAAIFFLYTRFVAPQAEQGTAANVAPSAPASSAPEPVQATDSNVQNESSTQAESEAAEGLEVEVSTTAGQSVGVDTSNSPVALEPNPNYPELYGYELGTADVSDEEFLALVVRLRNDPLLLNDLLNELRAETDPERIKRLTAILGETATADVLPVAEELVYSADESTRKTGLALLNRIARNNPEAYDIANSILGSEADPQVLVSTINVMATPSNASAETKATAIAQIIPLAEHESAAVRRHSVSVLPRLTNDESLAPILYNALSDVDTNVREAAAYAFASYPFQPPEAVERLLELAENPDEAKGVRRAAMLALQNLAPSDEVSARVSAARNQMRNATRNR